MRTIVVLFSIFLVVQGYPNAGDLDSLIDSLKKPSPSGPTGYAPQQGNGGAKPSIPTGGAAHAPVKPPAPQQGHGGSQGGPIGGQGGHVDGYPSDGGYGGGNNAPKPIQTAVHSHPSSDVPVPCVTEHGDSGECVQYFLCNENNTINTDGSGIIDIRAGIPRPCEDYMDTCCLPGDKREHPITQAPPYKPPVNPHETDQGGHGTDQGGHGIDQGGHGTDQGGHGTDQGGHGTDQGGHGIDQGGHNGGQPNFKEFECGIRNPNGVGFRIKGDKDNEAQFGEFPWMVAILREEPLSHDGKKINAYQCGGSLIHPKVVLTAAHCVIGSKDGGKLKLKVRAGEWDTQTKKEILPHQDRNVAKIIHHEHYYAGGLFNDIAVLILESPVDYAENVGIICLPPANTKPPLTKCLASGWGKDLFGKGGRYQVILKKVELPIVEHGKCQKALRKTRLGARFELHRTFICAGGEAGKDTCKGDGGSPLVCPLAEHPGRYIQSGIVAWGIGCGESLTPGVYANVAVLREWIDDQMHLNDIDIAPYHNY